jgi:hypothetical protein
VGELLTELSRASSEQTQTPQPAADASAPHTATACAKAPEDSSDEAESDEDHDTQRLQEHCARLKKQLVHLAVEPPDRGALVELLKANPLAMVEASRDSGNVMFLLDCNCWGETDHRPWIRKVPVHKHVFEKYFKSVLEARCGSPDPEHLLVGDIFVMVDAGKERKRLFTKNMQVQKTGYKEPSPEC